MKSQICFNWLKRRRDIGRNYLSRRPGKFSEREIEYTFLFSHLDLSGGYRLLDVGSGESGLALILAHCGYGVTAIDIRPKHPWVAKGDVTQLPFNNNSFNVVVAISTLEHILCSDKAIEEILRVVVPHGLIILSFPYHPTQYIKDVYKQHNLYICSIFNDYTLQRWFADKAEIVEVDYWRQYSGVLWTEGTKCQRASRVSKDKAQGICMALRKL